MKSTLFPVLALFSLLSISFCLTSSSGSIDCEDKCMPLHNLTVEHNLEGEGGWELIDRIELRKTDNSVLCTRDTSINISGGDSERVASCAAQIPDMDAGTWSFKSCYIVDTANDSDDEQCFSESVTVEEWDCTSNTACDADEECYFNDCKKLDCGYCEYAYSHSCRAYECCSDSGCETGEKCLDHECIEMECTRDSECGPMEVCRDYECDEVDCKNSSVCEDDQECAIPEYDCLELDCEVGLIARNHSCIHPECLSDVSCPGTDVCTENDCVPVDCPDGVAREHACVPFDCHNDSDCLANEGCRSGFCQALECTGGLIPAFHQCSECDSDSDCADTHYCPSGTCVLVSCPGGEVFSHICIPPEPGAETPPSNDSGDGPGSGAPREKPFCPGFIILILLSLALFSWRTH